MTSPYILPLDSTEATLLLAGGKGENLAHLIRAGYPVPGGFVVTTHAYEAYLAANDLQAFVRAAAEGAHPDDPQSLEAAASAIRARFAAGTLPLELAQALTAAYNALDISSVAVAVRSSATAEDLPDLSFAGQQDTFLNVVGQEGLLRAVVDCWSSLWTARAIGYRARNGISHAGVALAVVVQAMIQSEAAGALFTANPLNGMRTETVIDATLGLGDALVSGQVEPDHYVVNSSGAILNKHLGSKGFLHFDSGIEASAGHPHVRTPAEASTPGIHLDSGIEASAGYPQALPDAAIVELAALGGRVQALFGIPQDIEWAWADDRLWLLQSRPITSLFPLPAGMPPEPLQVLISFGAVQGILDPITPMGQDGMRLFIAELANLFGGRVTYDTQRGLFVAAERLFINITGVIRHGLPRRLARPIAGQVEPGIRQALNAIWDDPRLAPATSRLSVGAIRRIAPVLLPAARVFVSVLLHPDAERARTQALIEETIAGFEARARAVSTLDGRLVLMQDVLRGTIRVLFTRLVPTFAPGMATLNLLFRLSAGLPGGRETVLEVTRGLPHNVTTEMDLALWATAQAIRSDPASLSRFEALDPAVLAGEYHEGRLPAAAQASLDAFMGRYGVRGVGEIDLGRPRWREDPIPVMAALRSYLQITDPEQAPDAVFRRGAASADAAVECLAEAVRETRGGRLKARLVRWAARRVRAVAGMRESPKFTIIRLMGIVRVALLDAGRDLAATGHLSQPDDIFFLPLSALYELAAAEASPSSVFHSSLSATVSARRQAYAREKQRRQMPRLMLSDGRAFYEGAGAEVSPGESALTGSPVSPGIVEGSVHVVLDPHGVALAPGEILVCPGTDPAWTPLFLAAGGLVMEVGGLMTHGSVVAREYGIPAVVGVTDATTVLRTGQRVRVDGTSGRVTVLS